MKSTWNTGRLYSVAGQRLAADCSQLAGDPYHTVTFVDIDRGITGEFPVVAEARDELRFRAVVIANYDLGNYASSHNYNLTKELNALAATCQRMGKL